MRHTSSILFSNAKLEAFFVLLHPIMPYYTFISVLVMEQKWKYFRKTHKFIVTDEKRYQTIWAINIWYSIIWIYMMIKYLKNKLLQHTLLAYWKYKSVSGYFQQQSLFRYQSYKQANILVLKHKTEVRCF